MKPYTGKVAFLTGASAGIGAALARELGRQGADVVLTARRAERLRAIAQEIEALGQRALAISADVTRDDGLRAAVMEARQELGRIDLVVANAGFGVVGPLDSLTLADYERQLDTNVLGVLRTIYATLDDLTQSRGRLVIVGSIAGYLTAPGASAYAMSKAAVGALARALRFELAGRGVSVTLVTPGFVESEIRRVDNQGVYHAGARDPIPGWLRMPAERAAKEIAVAALARRAEVTLTRHAKALLFVQRHAPWLLSGALRLGARARREPRAG
jgi:NADP-dependent 3-hydroxy acid dehydrogenase YdfG